MLNYNNLIQLPLPSAINLKADIEAPSGAPLAIDTPLLIAVFPEYKVELGDITVQDEDVPVKL